MVCNYCESKAFDMSKEMCLNCGSIFQTKRKHFSNAARYTISLSKLYSIGIFFGIMPVMLYAGKAKEGLDINDKRLTRLNMITWLVLIAYCVVASLIVNDHLEITRSTLRVINKVIVVCLTFLYIQVLKPYDEVFKIKSNKVYKSTKTFILYTCISLVVHLILIVSFTMMFE